MGWGVRALSFSPIKGPKGNIEFLADIRFGTQEAVGDDIVVEVVRQAHDSLD